MAGDSVANDDCSADVWPRICGGQVTLIPESHQVQYQSKLTTAIPELAGRMQILGYDWIGRPIGVSDINGTTLLLYDAIFDELLEFHSESSDPLRSPLFDTLQDNFGKAEYDSFLKAKEISAIRKGECAGFTIPPQLGGTVSYTNLEIYDVFVYWNYASLLQDALAATSEGSTLWSLKIEKAS